MKSLTSGLPSVIFLK